MLAVALGLTAGLTPGSASACGGFFCSQAAGVNQAAERIVFANNGDGTVTAVIEIQYQGPSDKFSWLLPISSVPEGDQIAVGSSLSFQLLQQATNPQYSLTTRVEGNCDFDEDDSLSASGGASASVEGGAGGGSANGGVTVEATGVVGSFEWAVISLDASLAEPADAAVAWLNDNGYDVPPGAPGLLGPYLADGMHLLALRLQKGATSGSIRPIVLTYAATKPMIPLKLTAVAANDDMGVLTWILGDGRAVPKNYYALELNEARINWFNPNTNYNAVVTAAADEAEGQGFVTEYVQPGSSLAGALWTEFDQSDWDQYKQNYTPSAPAAPLGLMGAMNRFSQWDGFWEVVRKHVSLPANVTVEELQRCPSCYAKACVLGPDFLQALESDVIKPAQVLQNLLDAHSKVTRLYSTLSANEMTVDPLFTFNPTLPNVSNLHTAERIIECQAGYYESEAPWRIQLPDGAVVRGGPSQVGRWPTEFTDLPANRRILRAGETGSGKVLEDNSKDIDAAVKSYSDSVEVPAPRPPSVTMGSPFPRGRGTGMLPEAMGGTSSGGNAATGGSSNAASSDTVLNPTGGGCNVATGSAPSGFWLGLLGAVALLRRRRAR
jgi:MYXO-CTERM domain-containing protein